MATYYVDTAGSNTSPYDTWAKAATDLQTAVNAVSGTGNTIYCRGTQTLTSGGTATVTLSSAPNGAGYGQANQIIGVNASGVDDGTYFVLDGADTNGAGGFSITGSQYWIVKNLHVKDTQGTGINSNNGIITFYINCKSTGNSGTGFDVDFCRLYKCISDDNTGSGFNSESSSQSTTYLFCRASANGGRGFNCNITTDVLYGCIVFDNSGNGIIAGRIINCVIHGNGDSVSDDGIRVTNMVSVGNRITSTSGWGIGETNQQTSLIAHCFFDSNASGDIEDTFTGTEERVIDIVTSGTVGYTSLTAGSEDFTLTSSASLRNVEIDIPEP